MFLFFCSEIVIVRRFKSTCWHVKLRSSLCRNPVLIAKKTISWSHCGDALMNICSSCKVNQRSIKLFARSFFTLLRGLSFTHSRDLSCNPDYGDVADPVVCFIQEGCRVHFWEDSFSLSSRDIGRALLEISSQERLSSHVQPKIKGESF